MPIAANAEVKYGGASTWGRNNYGQIGDGSTVTRLEATTVLGLSGVRAVAAGRYHTLALLVDGTVRAWGYNGYGQLGDGSTATKKTPIVVQNLTDVVAIAAGGYHSLALKSDGTVWGWGRNNYGQLGDGTATTRKLPTKAGGATTLNATAIAAGAYHSLAVDGGQVKGWGYNTYGALGNGGSTTAQKAVVTAATTTGPLTNIVKVAAGDHHTQALTSSGTLKSWGLNSQGQLGDNTVSLRRRPVDVVATLLTGGVKDMDGGDLHSIAVLNGGEVRTWGYNANGQIGINSTTRQLKPVAVTTAGAATVASAGYRTSHIVLADRRAQSWGLNNYGQLGNGTKATSKVPAFVKNVTGAVSVSAGYYHAIQSDGQDIPVPVGNGPLSWWSGEGDFLDPISENDGVPHGAVGFATGYIGCGFNLDGVTDGDGETSSIEVYDWNLDPETAFSFVGWIYPKSVTGTKWIASKQDSDSATLSYAFGINGGKLQFEGSQDGEYATRRTVTTSSAVMVANAWKHVALVYDGSLADADKVQLYVGGVRATATYGSTPPYASLADTSDSLRFGMYSAASPRAFQGVQDELRFYNRSLTPAEISQQIADEMAAAGGGCDGLAPTTTAVQDPAPNAAGWTSTSQLITLTATDNAGGSGVTSITYSASGAETIDETAVEFDAGDPTTTDVLVSTDGETQLSYYASDEFGNSEVPNALAVRIDGQAPAITSSVTPQANAYGWNNSDVLLTFTCEDQLGLSGIPDGACPVATTAGEGAGQTVARSVQDRAGNTGETVVGPINVDKTLPALSGAASSSPNAAGWYRADVGVTWSCSDALSGVDGACPAPAAVVGEGANLSASTSVADRAGNVRAATVGGINIDHTAPLTLAGAPSGWSTGDVTVVLTPSDNLSGVKQTWFALDGGAMQPGTSSTVSGRGVHALEYWSEDRAGNVEPHTTLEIKIDDQPPTIAHLLDPFPNDAGWNNTDVTVTFLCGDEVSSVVSCTSPVTVATEGGGQIVTGTAADEAGNTATDLASVGVDKTRPTITAALSQEPNDAGWHRVQPRVVFTCEDQAGLSGIATCPEPVVVPQGIAHIVIGTSFDAAGNLASAVVAGINVDTTPPSLSGASSAAPNGAGWYTGDVTITWMCTDTLSGVLSSPEPSVITAEGRNLGASAVCSDRAGNVAVARVDGINVDRTAPVTNVVVPAPLSTGWYAGAFTFDLPATDNLSGVAATWYRVDDGEPVAFTAPFTFDLRGSHMIKFWSTDAAGNVETVEERNEITIQVDDLVPSITGRRMPPANGHGWNNHQVVVRFECSDAESGVAACTDDVLLVNEGTGQSVQGTAVDFAGNLATAIVGDINIDLTAPALTGRATTPPNAAGWYRDDVTVQWTAEDALSGINDATLPDEDVVTGEGATLQAGPVTVSDKAGNAQSATVPGIRIDRTPPRITGAQTTEPNDAGWYNGAVTVAFACTDDLSGVATCASDQALTTDGASQSVTSSGATDLAGNSAAGISVGDINIDGRPPQTTADNQCTRTNGWCTGGTATVVLTATDQSGLSGVREIRYRVNGGAEQVVSGATAVVGVPLDGSGEASVRFYAVDRAGNAETQNAVSLEYDNIAPSVTHSLTPAANAADWNRSDVGVHFYARDDDAGSGVDASTVTADSVVAGETAGVTILGSARDVAGNLGTDSVTVKLDKTAPVVSVIPQRAPNENGWYNAAVTFHFACSDSLSGVAVCSDPVTLTNDGANQSVSGSVSDAAGNVATASLGGIDIDSRPPEVSIGVIANGATYVLGAVPSPTCTASDPGGSGTPGCVGTRTGGTPNGVGTFTYTATAADRAGNVTTRVVTYRVVYRFDGFLQPVTDTAHQTGATASVFKAGSTVPLKFRLKRADGTVASANEALQWLTPAKGGITALPPEATLYDEPATSGSVYRLDGDLYLYNWGTAKTQIGYYWRVGVALDDGRTYVVDVGLR